MFEREKNDGEMGFVLRERLLYIIQAGEHMIATTFIVFIHECRNIT